MKLFSKIKNIIATLFSDKVVIERGMTITKAIEIKAILAPIPNKNFINNAWGLDNSSLSCSLGHIHRALSPKGYNDYTGDRGGYGAANIVYKFMREVHDLDSGMVSVNDENNVNGYTEPITKDRVMHLVNDMISAGY